MRVRLFRQPDPNPAQRPARAHRLRAWIHRLLEIRARRL